MRRHLRTKSIPRAPVRETLNAWSILSSCSGVLSKRGSNTLREVKADAEHQQRRGAHFIEDNPRAHQSLIETRHMARLPYRFMLVQLRATTSSCGPYH